MKRGKKQPWTPIPSRPPDSKPQGPPLYDEGKVHWFPVSAPSLGNEPVEYNLGKYTAKRQHEFYLKTSFGEWTKIEWLMFGRSSRRISYFARELPSGEMPEEGGETWWPSYQKPAAAATPTSSLVDVTVLKYVEVAPYEVVVNGKTFKLQHAYIPVPAKQERRASSPRHLGWDDIKHLSRRAREGEQDAWDTLISDWRGLAYFIAKYQFKALQQNRRNMVLGNHEDIEDVVQRVCQRYVFEVRRGYFRLRVKDKKDRTVSVVSSSKEMRQWIAYNTRLFCSRALKKEDQKPNTNSEYIEAVPAQGQMSDGLALEDMHPSDHEGEISDAIYRSSMAPPDEELGSIGIEGENTGEITDDSTIDDIADMARDRAIIIDRDDIPIADMAPGEIWRAALLWRRRAGRPCRRIMVKKPNGLEISFYFSAGKVIREALDSIDSMKKPAPFHRKIINLFYRSDLEIIENLPSPKDNGHMDLAERDAKMESVAKILGRPVSLIKMHLPKAEAKLSQYGREKMKNHARRGTGLSFMKKSRKYFL